MTYIYLDQNKWIELAKGIKDNDSKYINLYNLIINNIEKEIWAFPISLIHILETMKRNDERSRKDILELMFSMSKGYSIYDYMTVDAIEFDYWINQLQSDFSNLKSKIICRDWSAILGISSDNAEIQINNNLCTSDKNEVETRIRTIIKNHCCDKEIFDLICNIVKEDSKEDENFYYTCYKRGREEFQKWKENIQMINEYSEKQLYPAYLINTFMKEYEKPIRSLSPESQENIKNIFLTNNKNKTSTIANLETLPGFNIHNRLIFELFNNPDKKVHAHDFNDLAYLRVAVPYCDVVIGEKYWCDRICHYKFDSKYNTKVYTNLFSLLDL